MSAWQDLADEARETLHESVATFAGSRPTPPRYACGTEARPGDVVRRREGLAFLIVQAIGPEGVRVVTFHRRPKTFTEPLASLQYVERAS